MAQKKFKPWLRDERSHDDRQTDFYTRDERSVEWRLMAAWDDPPEMVYRFQGNVVDLKLKDDADKQTDALAAGWIRDIAARIGALLSELPTPIGALTSVELLNAADDRISSAHNDEQKVTEECEALRQESQRRIAVPLLKLVNEFKREITHLAASDAVKAGYLRNIVSDLEKLAGTGEAKPVVADEGFAEAVSNAGESPHKKPEWIASQVMARCLAGLDRRSADKWKRALDGSRKWLTDSRFYLKGKRPKRPNQYQPVLLMEAIILKHDSVSLHDANIVFHQKSPLNAWREEWDKYAENNALVLEGRTRT